MPLLPHLCLTDVMGYHLYRAISSQSNVWPFTSQSLCGSFNPLGIGSFYPAGPLAQGTWSRDLSSPAPALGFCSGPWASVSHFCPSQTPVSQSRPSRSLALSASGCLYMVLPGSRPYPLGFSQPALCPNLARLKTSCALLRNLVTHVPCPWQPSKLGVPLRAPQWSPLHPL